MKNIHCMSGLGQGYATRFVYPAMSGIALYFDDTRLTNPDTSGATVYRKPNDKKYLKNLAEPVRL